MPDELMDGQTVLEADDGRTMTADDLVQAVSDAVGQRVSESVDALSERMGALEATLESVAGSTAGRLQVEGLAERLDTVQAAQVSLSAQVAQVEEATLQAGEEIGPVIGEEIGSVIVELIGGLLELVDSDSDGASDVGAAVEEIRANVADMSAVLLHPAMETSFSDYTVLEALLLLLVVGWFIKMWLKILGGGFYWLR